MANYLKIYRPLNLLFIALAQCFAGYYLNFSAHLGLLIEEGVFWFILATASTAAYGYWVNDLMDRKRDELNGKSLKFIHVMNRYSVYAHLLLFLLLALYSANQVDDIRIRLLVVASLFILSIYSLFLKNIAGIGNVLIGVLCFFSIYAIRWIFEEVDPLLIIHFATLAGTVTLARELVKDAEDAEGDRETKGRTVPILFGLKATNSMVYGVLLFAISFAIVSLYYQRTFLFDSLKYVYYAYYLIFVLYPLYRVAIDVRFATQKEDYNRLSLFLKYALFTGVLSMMFY